MDKFREQTLLSSCSSEEWDQVLDNYGYPKRPCDTKCFDACPARTSCPLYTAWERRAEKDKERCDREK